MSTLPVIKPLVSEINNIPELEGTYKYRPTNIAENKTVMMAVEMKDDLALFNALVAIVSDCFFNKIDVLKIPYYLLDYLYLQIYIKSAESALPLNYTCGNIVQNGDEFEPCEGKILVAANLNQAVIKYPDNFEKLKIIPLDAENGIKLRVPTYEDIKKIEITDKKSIDVADSFVFSCIESVYTKDKVITPATDVDRDELTKWIGTLPGSVMEQINEFYSALPYLSLTLKLKCPKCGREETVELQGIDDFLA